MKQKIAKKSDLENGQMKLYKVDDTKILLCRIDNQFYAVSGTCPHYGAPLDHGVLSGHRVVCPWHHASFDVATGHLEEPPALDGLKKFEVTIDGEDVMLDTDKEPASAPPVTMDPKKDERTFVIIGSGAAGNMAAQTLREDGFRGRLVMVNYEERVPYDRPELSKQYMAGKAKKEWLPLRDLSFYKDRDIEWMAKHVTSVNPEFKEIKFDDGTHLPYDACLIATGGRPKTLDVAGKELQNIFTLRSYEDSDKIIEAAKSASKVAIVGASFIGMETAFSLISRDLDVTVIAPEEVPFERFFGQDVGNLFLRLHKEKGTKFRLGETVDSFQGESKVKSVKLKSGETLDADLVIIGIGVTPVTDFLGGVEKRPDNSIDVDDTFQVTDGLWAAGDVARFPDWRSPDGIRIEHWRLAKQHGRDAAHNMAGKPVKFNSVPFFWTTQVGLHFRFVGHVQDWDELLIQGDVEKPDFIAYYIKHDKVYAAAGVKRDKEMAAIEELFRREHMPPPKDLDDSFDPIKRLADIR
jgi:NADPH-dependent 2,4-dienoyl-CoA reductase/sulfur reductase-like enzyme/nitrite reductase/ring-hydroxylating ferredoxin subunit